MTKLSRILAVSSLVASGAAFAQAAAPASPHTFTGKVALYSEYEYRGISQTSEDPALQGTFDYAHASGFYVGTFITNIKWLKDTADVVNDSTSAKIEWDIYGGYKWGFAANWTLDVGYLRYEYPSSKALGFPVTVLAKPNTDEVYIGVSYGPATLKYSYAFSELFGVIDSEGSDYLELAVNQPIWDKLTLNAVIGHQRYAGVQNGFNNSNFDYTVWKLGATYDFGNGFTAGGYWKDTDADPQYFTFKGKDWSKGRAVGFVAWSF